MIANEAMVTALSNINGIVNLTSGSIGPAVATKMIHQQELLPLSQNVIKPFYHQKVQRAVELLRRYPDPRFKITT